MVLYMPKFGLEHATDSGWDRCAANACPQHSCAMHITDESGVETRIGMDLEIAPDLTGCYVPSILRENIERYIECMGVINKFWGFMC